LHFYLEEDQDLDLETEEETVVTIEEIATEEELQDLHLVVVIVEMTTDPDVQMGIAMIEETVEDKPLDQNQMILEEEEAAAEVTTEEEIEMPAIHLKLNVKIALLEEAIPDLL